jgi:DNA-binding transcriptional regulator YiaG
MAMSTVIANDNEADFLLDRLAAELNKVVFHRLSRTLVYLRRKHRVKQKAAAKYLGCDVNRIRQIESGAPLYAATIPELAILSELYKRNLRISCTPN